MNALQRVVTLLREHLDGERATVAIAHEFSPDESSLYATPAGYVHFACTLLETVLAAQEGRASAEPDGAVWDGAIKHACMDLPVGSTSLVGAYVCPSHDALLAKLQALLASDLPPGTQLSSDPSLSRPSPAT